MELLRLSQLLNKNQQRLMIQMKRKLRRFPKLQSLKSLRAYSAIRLLMKKLDYSVQV
jgi:hypothetical protein